MPYEMLVRRNNLSPDILADHSIIFRRLANKRSEDTALVAIAAVLLLNVMICGAWQTKKRPRTGEAQSFFWFFPR
jgi:hypothetical protein